MRLDTNEKRQQYRAAIVAKMDKDARSTDYAEVYTQTNGCIFAKGFIGNSGKAAFFHSFKTEAQREAFILRWLDSMKQGQDYKDSRKAQKSAFVPSLKVGQLMSGSWGYDQTNAELWEVTRLIGKCTAELRKVKCRAVPGSEGFMCETLQPIKGEYSEREAPVTARIQEGNRCRIHRCCTVSPCDENSRHYSSWYA